jgi:hypothetical protein
MKMFDDQFDEFCHHAKKVFDLNYDEKTIMFRQNKNGDVKLSIEADGYKITQIVSGVLMESAISIEGVATNTAQMMCNKLRFARDHSQLEGIKE